jgi:hypothetical protein
MHIWVSFGYYSHQFAESQVYFSTVKPNIKLANAFVFHYLPYSLMTTFGDWDFDLRPWPCSSTPEMDMQDVHSSIYANVHSSNVEREQMSSESSSRKKDKAPEREKCRGDVTRCVHGCKWACYEGTFNSNNLRSITWTEIRSLEAMRRSRSWHLQSVMGHSWSVAREQYQQLQNNENIIHRTAPGNFCSKDMVKCLCP